MASEQAKLTIHTREAAAAPTVRTSHRRARRLRVRTRLSFRERLLRNSCLACAVLLGILALSNVQQPWAQHAAQSIEQALTMKVDLDQSFGELSFVRKLMPESAMVFFNLSADTQYTRPVPGKTIHAYNSQQPWLLFESAPGETVCAPADGQVTAVSSLSDGSFGLIIDHGEGFESIIAGCSALNVQQGEHLVRGTAIGTAAGSIYYEMRRGGEACDPTQLMGL